MQQIEKFVLLLDDMKTIFFRLMHESYAGQFNIPEHFSSTTYFKIMTKYLKELIQFIGQLVSVKPSEFLSFNSSHSP